jgi:hypothetical protein
MLGKVVIQPLRPCGPAPLKGSLCCKEAQADDMHRTLILESLGIQAVERVDYRLGSVCTQIQTIFLPPEEAPLPRRSLPAGWGAGPQGPEGFKTQEYESALPKVLSEKLRYGGQGGDSKIYVRSRPLRGTEGRPPSNSRSI